MNKAKQIQMILISALLVTAVIGMGALRRVDRWTQDWLFQRPGVSSRDIVIIGIDETAFDFFGRGLVPQNNYILQVLEIDLRFNDDELLVRLHAAGAFTYDTDRDSLGERHTDA